jgi:hypothetical protein
MRLSALATVGLGHTLGMRVLIAGVVGTAAAGLTYMGIGLLLLMVGGTECDRGECNAVGEFIDEHRVIAGVAVGLIALMAGAITFRAVEGGRNNRRIGPRSTGHL